jgi:hypothetical protein
MPEGSVRRYLVLVVGTLAGPGPAGELLRLSRQEPSAFHFVVPATVPDYGWTWTETQPLADTRERNPDHDGVLEGHGLDRSWRGPRQR